MVPLILILPVAIASLGYQFHWHWFPLLDLDEGPALLAYAMTLSISKTGIAVILCALSALTLLSWRDQRRSLQLLVFFCCLMAALGSAFVTKSVAKQFFKEPRPYVLWLAEQGRLTDSARFYAQLPQIRELWLRDSLSQMSEQEVPGWLKHHWRDEVSYSFPSGHSIAAMTIASFYCLLLAYRRRSPWLVAGLATWAVAVCYSRLLLGLHWPVDILASSVLGVLFGMLGAGLFMHWDKRAADRAQS